jgi:hypothetical protein
MVLKELHGASGSPRCQPHTRPADKKSYRRKRYVGKETFRRLEQGDDISMVDFRCKKYTDGKMVADQEIRKRIAEIGIRRVARDSWVNRETVALYCQRQTGEAKHASKGRQMRLQPSHAQRWG